MNRGIVIITQRISNIVHLGASLMSLLLHGDHHQDHDRRLDLWMWPVRTGGKHFRVEAKTLDPGVRQISANNQTLVGSH